MFLLATRNVHVLIAEKVTCVRCKSSMHISYECDAYRMRANRALEIKPTASQTVSNDATDSRPCAGPLLLSKRVPEHDSQHYDRQVQDKQPCPEHLARQISLGQIGFVIAVKEHRVELKSAYPKPIDRPHVFGHQDPNGSWLYDDKAWLSGWKFLLPKSPNLKASVLGTLAEPSIDEDFLFRSRDAWFIRKREQDTRYSVTSFPPWVDHVVPSLSTSDALARHNRAHMIKTNELYCKDVGATMANRPCASPTGSLAQQRNSKVTRLLPVRI